MSIDPKWLAEKTLGKTIDRARACACGYNLQGLHAGGKCPECGRLIPFASGAVKGPKFAEYPRPELARLARGMTLAAWGVTLLSGGWLLVWGISAVRVTGMLPAPRTMVSTVLMAAVVPGALAWWAGLMLIAARASGRDVKLPTPTPADMLAARPAWFGWMLRLGQAFWPVAAGLTLASSLTGGHADPVGFALAVGAWVAATIASLTAPPACLMLYDLGHISADDYATNRFHGLTFGLPVVAATLAFIPMIEWAMGLSLAFFAIAVTLYCVLVSPAVWLLNSASWSLASTCRWAVNNSASAEEREARFRERAERLQRTGGARASR